MSWAEEDWTVGLSGRVLQKVKELQVHQERLSRENKQKQLQLDNIQLSLEKQTAKYEEVRGELQFVQRDLQSVRDEAKAAVTSRERLSQELHTKQAQVCSLEGQLDATRTQNNKLTQEIKRLEAELEKLQNSSRSLDTTLFSTPCWNSSSPWEHNGGRRHDERSGTRDEAQSQHSHIRQRLPFSDVPAGSVSRQHKSTPHRHSSDQSESFSTPSSVFPWERDDTRHSARRPSPSSPQIPSSGLSPPERCGMEKDHKAQADASFSEMQSRVSCLEEELSAKAKMLKSIQSDVAQSKKELTARELSLQKARDEISMAHTRISQESQRASGAEQKLKQLQEELKCQRQNAESSRLQHQQKTKELEKQHQRDITELQKERQLLEKQHQQEVNKLNQELQQARTLHNVLQAQADKLSLQKQALDKELDTLKEKLKWTEGQLQESQKKEAQTQAKLTEALREAEAVAVSLEQSRKRERGLEEEKRSLTEERADALRLLKELQEQKATPATPQQPVQFHSQPSYAPPPRPSDCIKRPTANSRPGQKKKGEDVEEIQADITAPYPSDREPGEGIDSEDITILNSQDSQSLEIRRKGNEEERRHEAMDFDGSQIKDSSVSNPADGQSNNSSVEVFHHSMVSPEEKSLSLNPEQTKAEGELKRENTMLRSEIKDIREELQKRLEDLETQRRAEAETRTRLKQLSRKHASQATEKQEQEREWKAKLESEKTEVERLKKTIAGMETEMKRKKEERGKREKEEEQEEKIMEDRESEMIELNIQLKKQLSEVKAQLALEREERHREEEERSQRSDAELSTKLAELQAELEELKHSKKEQDKGAEDRKLLTNSPLAYLTLQGDEFNSNIVNDNQLLLSPEQHLLFCQSTNQINTLVSQGTDSVQEEKTVIETKSPSLSSYSLTSQEAMDQEDSGQNVCEAVSLSDQQEGDDLHLQKSEFSTSHLEKEVIHLQKEKAKETDRANKNQVKLEALQNQVTCQTQQLTKAFEKQSHHISGLLVELQHREAALLRQAEEMQKCKLELEALKAERKVNKDEENKEVVQFPELKHCAAQLNTSGSLSDVDSSALETQSHVSSEEDNEVQLLRDQHPDCEDSDMTENNQDSACVTEECSQGGETAAELLLLLQLENQLLKQKVKDLTGPTSLTNTQDTAVVPCPTEQWTSREQSQVKGEVQESLPNQMRIQDVAKEEQEDVSHDAQIKILEQQVEALQMRVQVLSTETQQQSEELSLWRLSSLPTPTLGQFKEENQPSDVSQFQSDQEGATTRVSVESKSNDGTEQLLDVQQSSPSTVTVVREDQLILSCSSNKLQGRMLFSRLQNQNVPEPKDLHQPKKTENSQETVIIDQESEKENLQWSDICPQQHTNKNHADSQTSLEKTGKHVPKEASRTKPTEEHMENHVSGPDSVRSSDGTNTESDSSERVVKKVEVKSVSSQTEESLCPELHSAYTQTEEDEEEEVESPPVSPVPSDGVEFVDKMFAGAFPIPADPARLAERIRRNRTQLSAAFDDTEYEPYGLPEVVMKGFADIPTGPSCPYIVRRGLLGTSVVPVSQKEEETD